jgi:hypothetical protein
VGGKGVSEVAPEKTTAMFRLSAAEEARVSVLASTVQHRLGSSRSQVLRGFHTIEANASGRAPNASLEVRLNTTPPSARVSTWDDDHGANLPATTTTTTICASSLPSPSSTSISSSTLRKKRAAAGSSECGDNDDNSDMDEEMECATPATEVAGNHNNDEVEDL